MIGTIRRFFLRQRWMRDYEKSLNRRAQVEQALFDVANGKEELPSREQCREWAMKLGVPEEWKAKR
jgi:ABC-type dipeptide/oligopeptide/nickel transport system ATPase subunit